MKPKACVHCGCTEDRACDLGGFGCSWAWLHPPVCSNPECVKKERAARERRGKRA